MGVISRVPTAQRAKGTVPGLSPLTVMTTMTQVREELATGPHYGI
jgi:hypothetical protein